ncbi:MAG: cytochrome c oxidase subunit 3, partial [Thermoleophilia bacterium]|nr:cytochrome c oxidase subunit 3 [Thermoleophilia bacterium]
NQQILNGLDLSYDTERFVEPTVLTEQEYAEFEQAVTTEVVGATANFGMRFYAPTAFHGFHVVVGVLLALQVLYLGSKGFYDDNPIGVELFGLYWHFVDVVWILLFTLIYLV